MQTLLNFLVKFAAFVVLTTSNTQAKLAGIMKDRLEIIKGDASLQKLDAIVITANKSLSEGSGIDGAVYRMGGSVVAEACRILGSCEVGQAVITPAGKLAAKYLIHAVGPVWAGGTFSEATKLRTIYSNCLQLAAEQGLRTIAFTSLCTGEYRYPKPMATSIAYKAIMSFLDTNVSVKKIVFCCNDEETYRLMMKQKSEYFSAIAV